MPAQRNARCFPVTMNLKNVYSAAPSTETDVLKSVVQDYFIAPFDCSLVGVDCCASAVAGTAARAATIDLNATGYTTNVDTILTAVTAGATGNSITIALAADSASVKAYLDLSTVTTNIDTVIQAATAGNSGNMIRIVIDGAATAGAGTVAEDLLSNIVYFHLQDGVSTVADFETLVTSATLLGASGVKTAGTAANIFDADTDEIDKVNLANGYLTCGTLTEASLNLATVTTDIDTVIEAVDTSATVDSGENGNNILISIVGGAAANAGVVAEDVANKKITFQLKNNGSTVTDFETLVGTCTLIDVKTGGTGANKFYQAKDCFLEVPLAGGISACKASLSGTAITVKCKNSSTTVTNIENQINNHASIAALVTAASGTGSNVWASSTDTLAATALAGGNVAKPTIDIYLNGSTVFSAAAGILVAGTVYPASFTDGQGGSRFERIKLAKNDKLSMRLTTTSTDGQMSNASATMLMEY